MKHIRRKDDFNLIYSVEEFGSTLLDNISIDRKHSNQLYLAYTLKLYVYNINKFSVLYRENLCSLGTISLMKLDFMGTELVQDNSTNAIWCPNEFIRNSIPSGTHIRSHCIIMSLDNTVVPLHDLCIKVALGPFKFSKERISFMCKFGVSIE